MRPHYLINFLFAGVRAIIYEEPFPRCEACLPTNVHNAPGIGFGLSFSSGTTAAHLYNGTVADIALVAASPDYVALMTRLVTSPKPSPLRKWNKWHRSINKKLGWPATTEVGILAGMLASLRDATNNALASPLDRVAVTHPPIPGLTEYDLSDALEHVGLRPWLASHLPRPKIGWPPLPEAGLYPEQLTEGRAVFAAHKRGLCEKYQNLWDCKEEEDQMKLEAVMVVGFTKGDLRAEVVRLRAPFDWNQGIEERLVDFSAGLDAIDNFESHTAYWAHVRNRLQTLLLKLPIRLTMVLLAGEKATHTGFLISLRDALMESEYVLGDNEGQVLVIGDEGGVIDPVFASARGAAQYARWRQEAPIGCEEPQDCQGQRAKEISHSEGERLEL